MHRHRISDADVTLNAFCAALVFFLLLGYFVHDCGRQSDCERAGGHVHRIYKDWLCVDEEQRIIEDY